METGPFMDCFNPFKFGGPVPEPDPFQPGLSRDENSRRHLIRYLNDQQRAQFARGQSFSVSPIKPGPWSKRTFHITPSFSYNVTDLKSGQQFCLVTPGVTIFEHMLNQKILLETDPMQFFASANPPYHYGGPY